MADVLPLPVTPYWSLLQNRNYRRLWLGQLVSLLGDRVHEVALLVLVGTLTGGNLTSIGFVFGAIALPRLLFGLLAGALVDRWDRRAVMVAADLARVPLVLAIPTLARADLRWVYALTFLLTTATLFFRPAEQATIPAIVPEEDLLPANSLSSATDSFMDVLGYPLAGGLVAGLAGLLAGGRGVEMAFYLDAATYAFSALLILGIAVPRAGRGESGGSVRAVPRMVLDGLRFVGGHAVLRTNIILVHLAALLFAAGPATLSYGYAMDVTGTGAFGYAVLSAVLGLGATLGGLAVGRWCGGWRKGLMILAGLAAMGAAFGAIALFANLWWAAGMLFLGGAANMLFFIPTITLVQQCTPNELLGRVMSLRGVLAATVLFASNALAGALAECYGVRPIFGLTGGLLIVLAALGWLVPTARNVA